MNRRELLKALLTGGAVLATGAVLPPVTRKIFLPPPGGWPEVSGELYARMGQGASRWDALIDTYLHCTATYSTTDPYIDISIFQMVMEDDMFKNEKAQRWWTARQAKILPRPLKSDRDGHGASILTLGDAS